MSLPKMTAVLLSLLACVAQAGTNDLSRGGTAATNGLAAATLSRLTGFVKADVRTAYHARGRILERGPMAMTLSRLGYDTDLLGRFGFWNWNVSSLGRSRQGVHRRPFHEVDVGAYWRYDVAFDDAAKWKLTTDVMKDWITLDGYTESYRARKVNATISEWRLEQALENPYVTPYYLIRRGVHPTDWTYYRTGVRHAFKLPWDFTFTPAFFVESGDERFYERRYGAPVDKRRRHHSGPMSVNLLLDLSWKASDNLSFYANVQQYDLVSESARDNVRARNVREGRRDLTIFAAGLRVRF